MIKIGIKFTNNQFQYAPGDIVCLPTYEIIYFEVLNVSPQAIKSLSLLSRIGKKQALINNNGNLYTIPQVGKDAKKDKPGKFREAGWAFLEIVLTNGNSFYWKIFVHSNLLDSTKYNQLLRDVAKYDISWYNSLDNFLYLNTKILYSIHRLPKILNEIKCSLNLILEFPINRTAKSYIERKSGINLKFDNKSIVKSLRNSNKITTYKINKDYQNYENAYVKIQLEEIFNLIESLRQQKNFQLDPKILREVKEIEILLENSWFKEIKSDKFYPYSSYSPLHQGYFFHHQGYRQLFYSVNSCKQILAQLQDDIFPSNNFFAGSLTYNLYEWWVLYYLLEKFMGLGFVPDDLIEIYINNDWVMQKTEETLFNPNFASSSPFKLKFTKKIDIRTVITLYFYYDRETVNGTKYRPDYTIEYSIKSDFYPSLENHTFMAFLDAKYDQHENILERTADVYKKYFVSSSQDTSSDTHYIGAYTIHPNSRRIASNINTSTALFGVESDIFINNHPEFYSSLLHNSKSLNEAKEFIMNKPFSFGSFYLSPELNSKPSQNIDILFNLLFYYFPYSIHVKYCQENNFIPDSNYWCVSCGGTDIAENETKNKNSFTCRKCKLSWIASWCRHPQHNRDQFKKSDYPRIFRANRSNFFRINLNKITCPECGNNYSASEK